MTERKPPLERYFAHAALGMIRHGRLLLAVAAMLLLCGATNAKRSEVARGRYLVERVMVCGDCHTPRIHGKPDRKRRFRGGPLPFEVSKRAAKYAPSIAGLPNGWSRAQFVHFMETGVTPSGVPARHPMPPFRLDSEDANAVASYLISLKK
jgi:mono/diheme cytochrome c family protein